MFENVQWSDLPLYLLYFAVFVIAYTSARRAFFGTKTLPPGPKSFPLIGSAGVIKRIKRGQPPYEAFAEEAGKYGGIISIWFGWKHYVILNGYDAIHNAFVKHADDFVDRPDWMPQLMNEGGLSWSNGEKWEEIRAFTLRKLGVGQQTMEDKIMDEVNEVCRVLRGRIGRPISIRRLFQYAANDVLCAFIFGKRFAYDNDDFNELLDSLEFHVKDENIFDMTLLNFLPYYEAWNCIFANVYERRKAKRANIRTIERIIGSFIKEHKESADESSAKDFIDLYIRATSGGEQASNVTHLHKDNMYRVIKDLFLSGSETTSSALDWAFLYMIEHPDEQKKCRETIETHVGQRPVKLSDRTALPYVEAVIQEVLRLSNVVPLGIPHTCADLDIVIAGYTIPKRTVILPNLYSANVDPKYWTDPFVFRPERFLNASGQLVKKKAFVPMSLGPRVCAGERLTSAQMFLIFANLLQKFRFLRENDSIRYDFSRKSGEYITMAPNPYKVRVHIVQ